MYIARSLLSKPKPMRSSSVATGYYCLSLFIRAVVVITISWYAVAERKRKRPRVIQPEGVYNTIINNVCESF